MTLSIHTEPRESHGWDEPAEGPAVDYGTPPARVALDRARAERHRRWVFDGAPLPPRRSLAEERAAHAARLAAVDAMGDDLPWT